MKAATMSNDAIGRYWLAERADGGEAAALAWCENTNEWQRLRVKGEYPIGDTGRMAVEANCILHAINRGLARPEFLWAPWDEVEFWTNREV